MSESPTAFVVSVAGIVKAAFPNLKRAEAYVAFLRAERHYQQELKIEVCPWDLPFTPVDVQVEFPIYTRSGDHWFEKWVSRDLSIVVNLRSASAAIQTYETPFHADDENLGIGEHACSAEQFKEVYEKAAQMLTEALNRAN